MENDRRITNDVTNYLPKNVRFHSENIKKDLEDLSLHLHSAKHQLYP